MVMVQMEEVKKTNHLILFVRETNRYKKPVYLYLSYRTSTTS